MTSRAEDGGLPFWGLLGRASLTARSWPCWVACRMVLCVAGGDGVLGTLGAQGPVARIPLEHARGEREIVCLEWPVQLCQPKPSQLLAFSHSSCGSERTVQYLVPSSTVLRVE